MRGELFVSAMLVVSGVRCLSTASQPSLHDAYEARHAYEYTARIVGFGERQPGQAGHKKTEELIVEVLQKDGAQIERDDFTAKTPRGYVPVHNIIGKFNVTANSQQPIFILAGHYDTLVKKGFIGANDGGSSTAILLSFADALAHQKTKMQIWLFWTDTEEGTFDTFEGHPDGLYGSVHYAQKLAASGLVPRIRGFFLLDMIGDKDLNVARESQSTRWLQDFISRAAAQLGYAQYFFQYATSITDDQVSFLNVGIPAVDIVDAQFGRMGPNFDGMGEFHHANADTMDKVSEKSLEIVGRTVLLTVELIDAQDGGVTQRLEHPSAPSMSSDLSQSASIVAAVRENYVREFGEVIPIPAIFNDERSVDCLKRGHLTTTAYLKRSAKRSTLLEMYLSRDGTRVLSKRTADVVTPAGKFKVVVVIVRYPATVGNDALELLGAAQRQVNDDHAAFARAHGYATPIVQFDNTNVTVDPAEIGDPHKPADVRAAAIRAGVPVEGADFVIVLDPDPMHAAGGLATPPNGDVYVGNFGRWTATLGSREWLSIARTAYHHEVAHHWGWMHDWTPTCGGTRLGFEPFVIAPILAGWDDVDGDGVPEVLDKSPYGRPR